MLLFCSAVLPFLSFSFVFHKEMFRVTYPGDKMASYIILTIFEHDKQPVQINPYIFLLISDHFWQIYFQCFILCSDVMYIIVLGWTTQ